MRRLMLLLGVLAAAMGIVATPAVAANQLVTVQDDYFSPARVAVKPGDSVTWSNPGSGEVHNVYFEDGTFTSGQVSKGPWMETRTFSTAGKYGYYCQQHQDEGMVGVVYVNNLGQLPPLVALSASANLAESGQTVTFDASGSSDANGIARYQWDLDGSGAFATDTGAVPKVSRAYSGPASLIVTVRVTDNQGLSDVKSVSLQVNAPPPVIPPATPPPVVPPSVIPPAVPPSVSGYQTTNQAFRIGTAPTPTTGRAAAKKAAVGTAFKYKLSKAATVKIALRQLLPGRRSGKTCVGPTTKLTKARPCVRAVSRGTLVRTSHAGANSVKFSGRIGSKALKPGSYQATLIATDAAGKSSRPKTLTFKVVRG